MNTHDEHDETPDDAALKPRPVTDAVRAQVAELHRQGLGRNAIARTLQVAAGTVTKIAKQHKPPLTFDREETALALRARQVDLATIRETLARKFLVAADDALEALHAPMVLGNFGGSDNTWNETLMDEPTIEGKSTLIKTATAAAAKGIELLKVDAANGSVSARGVVIELRDALTRGLEEAEAAGTAVDPTVTPDEQAHENPAER